MVIGIEIRDNPRACTCLGRTSRVRANICWRHALFISLIFSPNCVATTDGVDELWYYDTIKDSFVIKKTLLTFLKEAFGRHNFLSRWDYDV